MSKKQEMVSELTKRIESGNVELCCEYDCMSGSSEQMPLCTTVSDYWKKYPDGYFRDSKGSVESVLACLTNESLEKILGDDSITADSSWDTLWLSWGRKGYLRSDASLLTSQEWVPTLRLRHDRYLSWFQGYRFHLTDDLFNGRECWPGSDSLPDVVRAITLSDLVFDQERKPEMCKQKWYRDNALFRRAMLFGCVASACSNTPVFYRVLHDNTKIFDEFLSLSDKYCTKTQTDDQIGVKNIRRAARKSAPTSKATVYGAYLQDSRKDKGIFGWLSFGLTYVSLSMIRDGKDYTLTLNFPKWDRQAYEYERENIDCTGDKPVQLPYDAYLYTCWCTLLYALLALADILYTPMWMSVALAKDVICYSSLDLTSQHVVASVKDIWDDLWDISRELGRQ